VSRKERLRIGRIFRKLAETIDPKSDLEFSNTFELLLAVILSAQATDVGVNKATRILFPKIKGPQDVVDMGEAALAEDIRTIGLWRNKAKNIVKCCATLIEKHGGEVPKTRPELEALAGVGKKTAGVVMNVGYGAPTIPVDTHVFRLSKRLGLADEKTPDKTELALLKVVPKAYLKTAHHLLILHGRYVCKARKPLCESCDVARDCSAEDKRI
jgi:endonuclease-3